MYAHTHTHRHIRTDEFYKLVQTSEITYAYSDTLEIHSDLNLWLCSFLKNFDNFLYCLCAKLLILLK